MQYITKLGSKIGFKIMLLLAPYKHLCKFTWKKISMQKHAWCNWYHDRQWIQKAKFESWMRLFAFCFIPMLFGTTWILLFYLLLHDGLIVEQTGLWSLSEEKTLNLKPWDTKLEAPLKKSNLPLRPQYHQRCVWMWPNTPYSSFPCVVIF